MEQLQAMRQDNLQPSQLQATRAPQTARRVLDARLGTLAQKQPAETINHGPHAARMRSASEIMNNSPRMAAQRKLQDDMGQHANARLGALGAMMNGASTQLQAQGGLPPALKSGVESLSGISMDPVRVHYNSARPAQLNAHAFAQGADIHLAPGQERHLPHEAWHVAQQAQSRVMPTLQAAGGIAINDDPSLEREADVMGARAATAGLDPAQGELSSSASSNGPIQGNFFAKAGNTYTWHPEDPDDSYHQLPEMRRYYGMLNPLNLFYPTYPVYTREAVDRSGRPVGGGATAEEQQRIDEVFNTIQGTPYEDILEYLEDRIIRNLGADVLAQFYRGAHIIFNDDGAVYNRVFALGRPVAKLRPQSWGEWFWGEQVEATPENLGPATKGGAGLGARRPERRETSHYTQDDLPQIGIDLPGALSGHILVGLVPNEQRYGRSAGQSFVQTEMFGFKTFYDHYIGHGKGFFWNFVASHQSGLVGYCKYSEKSRTEIREQDNPHVPLIQGKFKTNAPAAKLPSKSYRGAKAQRREIRAPQRPPIQRKISFDGGNPLLELGVSEEAAAEMRQTLISFGDISANAAARIVLAMQSDATFGISRNEAGEIEAEGGLDPEHRIDAKSLYDLYRRRLQLLGMIQGLRRTEKTQEIIGKEASTKEAVKKVIKEQGLAPKDYGEHHGNWYKLGLTSVFNSIVDQRVEGFDPESTDFSDFTIQPPHTVGGEKVATGKGGQILADGWYMYVIGKGLTMQYFYTNNYVREDKADRSKVFSQYIPHTVLSAGEAVWAAGTFLIRDGQFAVVDNGSGHYRPSPGSLGVVRAQLSGLGYNVAKTKFLQFEETVELGGTKEGAELFPNLKGIDVSLVRKGLFFMNRPEQSPEIQEHFQSANKPSEEALRRAEEEQQEAGIFGALLLLATVGGSGDV